MPSKPPKTAPPDARSRKIVVTENGPYEVSGNVPIQVQTIQPNSEGMSWEWVAGRTFETEEPYYLCRCGQSSHKPFCDGTHEKVRFNGRERASREPYDGQAGVLDGPTLQLQDAEALCAFARFCDPEGKIWSLVPESDDPRARELAIREGMHCPGGRLVVHDKPSGKPFEPELPPSIGVIEDPAMECSGALWVRGGITVVSGDGTPYEVRNRVALCRCGGSKNKPFCDGTHASIRFRDGIT